MFENHIDKNTIYEVDIASIGAPHGHHMVGVTYKKNGKLKVAAKPVTSDEVGFVFDELEGWNFPVKLFDPDVKTSRSRDKLEILLQTSRDGLNGINIDDIYR